MASVPTPAVSVHRLAEHLHQLSEVAESLTYRLLELEERLETQELQLRSITESVAGTELGSGVELEGRMVETEQRLTRIEAMLHGLDRQALDRAGPTVLRHLHSPRPPAIQQDPLPDESSPAVSARARLLQRETPQEGPAEVDPFIEEAEQPFMDEQIA